MDSAIDYSKANSFFNLLLMLTIAIQSYIYLVTESYLTRFISLTVIIASVVIILVPMTNGKA
ncbi:hypothetical protein V1525DRAFT_399133 [Lipomyces kononenkoae]|uniref:Uncharacterized protein n=1 Tax=Lipomyces kononenkoae TaxID=34357 RepID=A0ACC3T883_LIPKO